MTRNMRASERTPKKDILFLKGLDPKNPKREAMVIFPKKQGRIIPDFAMRVCTECTGKVPRSRKEIEHATRLTEIRAVFEKMGDCVWYSTQRCRHFSIWKEFKHHWPDALLSVGNGLIFIKHAAGRIHVDDYRDMFWAYENDRHIDQILCFFENERELKRLLPFTEDYPNVHLIETEDFLQGKAYASCLRSRSDKQALVDFLKKVRETPSPETSKKDVD